MKQPAMTALLSPEWYWKPEYYRREQEHVFQNHWVFAGLTEDLARPNDYVSFSIAGTPVVVRNMGGRLVAFRNVCSHRYSIIHPEGCGNAMFRCPYHGWTYDARGVPIGVPQNVKSFGLDNTCKKNFALDSLVVDQCGLFVFVRWSKKGPPLKEWLGPTAERLELVSQYLPKTYGRFYADWNCNWKMGVEVTLEGYHLPLVHPQSFGMHMGHTLAPDEVPEYAVIEALPSTEGISYFDPHSTSVAPLSEPSVHHLKTIATRLRMRQTDQLTGFEHYFIYPNFMVGVNEGVNACIQLYMPTSSETTRAYCWLLTGKPSSQHENGVIWEMMTKQWQKFTESNGNEDKVACEASHTGARHATRNAVIGQVEERLIHFQSMILRDVGGNHAATRLKAS